MITLTDLLVNVPPIEELQELVLVFSSEVSDALLTAQSTLPLDRKNRIRPVRLTDGRWILTADVLSEIGYKGLFKEGFMTLSHEYFSQVEVVPMSEVLLLIPISGET